MNGDKIVASAIGNDLKKYGWNYSFSNTPAAYLTGMLAGKRALKRGIEEGILDIGLHTPSKGANVFAALKGVVDAGVSIPYGEEILPSEDRLYGKHISEEISEKVEEVKSFVSHAVTHKRDVIPIHISGGNTKRFYRIYKFIGNLWRKMNIFFNKIFI